MSKSSLLSHSGVLRLALLLLAASATGLHAQTAAEDLSTKAATPATSPAVTPPDDLTQTELLKSYIRLREQLHAAELTIVNNRIEAEAVARAQAASITEKLDTIKLTMSAERERQQAEAVRAAAENERQKMETQQANRTVFIVAASFGAAGLLAMIFTALFQWRATRQMAEIVSRQPQSTALSVPPMGVPGTDPGLPSGQTVALSNQRLMSVIGRMEHRIFELEHTAQPPAETDGPNDGAPAEPDAAKSDVEVLPQTNGHADHSARIANLLTMGRALLNANNPMGAVGCYDEILKLDPELPEALLKKGVALERLKQDNDAIRYYDRAIAADSKMTLAYLYKGGVCNRQQRYDEALECYEQAMQSEDVVR